MSVTTRLAGKYPDRFQIFENLIKSTKVGILNIFTVSISTQCLFMFMFSPTFDIDSIPRRLGYIESQY